MQCSELSYSTFVQPVPCSALSQSKATAVVQLYHAHPNPRSWNKVKTGILCFVKDNPKKSYYFRLVDMAVSRGLHLMAYKPVGGGSEGGGYWICMSPLTDQQVPIFKVRGLNLGT